MLFLTKGELLYLFTLTFAFSTLKNVNVNTGFSSCNYFYSIKLKYIGQLLSRILPTICSYINKMMYTFLLQWAHSVEQYVLWCAALVHIFLQSLKHYIYHFPCCHFLWKVFSVFFKMDNSHGCWDFQTTMTVWPGLHDAVF